MIRRRRLRPTHGVGVRCTRNTAAFRGPPAHRARNETVSARNNSDFAIWRAWVGVAAGAKLMTDPHRRPPHTPPIDRA